MALHYSVTKQKVTVGPYANTDRYYAHVQSSGKLDIAAFAGHIAEHGSVYGKGDILAVLTMAISCIKELSLNGYIVSLGDLGTFYPKIGDQRSTASAADFDASNIGKVCLRWVPSKAYKNFRDEAVLNPIVTRANQSLVLAAQTAGQTTMTLYQGGSGSGSQGGGSGE